MYIIQTLNLLKYEKALIFGFLCKIQHILQNFLYDTGDIPLNKHIREGCDTGKPILVTDPNCPEVREINKTNLYTCTPLPQYMINAPSPSLLVCNPKCPVVRKEGKIHSHFPQFSLETKNQLVGWSVTNHSLPLSLSLSLSLSLFIY